ncbi:MAG TPA: S-layer homology domain-containing protein, partial [Chloroflexia bacterium]
APTAPTDNMEIFTQGVVCGNTPTPVPPTIPPTAPPTGTRTATRTATSTSISTSTSTRVASATAVNTSVATNTTGPVATRTSVPPTSCPLAFTDVPPSNEFYTYIRCLVCRFIISGYNDHTFRPNNNIIRGQIAKMVSNSAGFSDPPGAQIYEDVPPSNEFFVWINRLSNRGVMTGYPCGSNVFEPCRAGNRPYFRWNANATRGQISQIVARGAGITDPPGAQRYTDVPTNSTFFIPIQQLSNMGVMSGYPCGGTNPQTGQAEPCDSANRPYFRPGNLATRAQASKIVANTFFPGCVTPGEPLNSDANLPNKNMLRSAKPVPPAKPASND